jgi:hypothetical protein
MNSQATPGGRASARALISAGVVASMGMRAGSPSPLRRVPVAWQDSAWRPRLFVDGRNGRLKPRRLKLNRRASRLAYNLSRNRKQLLRRIIL